MAKILTSLFLGSTDTFKTLRSFRAVLFLTTADIVTVRSVPKELLLNHVFSRAGPVLPSPYKVNIER